MGNNIKGDIDMIGIYKIENKIDGKVYIGQSIDIDSRWLRHKEELTYNHHHNDYLQRSWNKYGKENFIFEVIEECEEVNLTNREQYWIDFYGGINSCNTYNNRDASSVGRLSDYTKLKISISQKGKPKAPGRTVSEDGRKRLSISHMGIKPTEETRRKMSEAKKGKKHTEESKKKISDTHKKRFKDNPELAKQISIRQSGRKLSDETKDKLRQLNIGKKYGKDVSKKHSDSLKKAYAEGRRKCINITVDGVTHNQSEWALILGVAPTSIVYQRKKGTVENYIRALVNRKGKMADALIDKAVDFSKSEMVDFLLGD